jgi:sugar phosphate isomerase/epimerase
MVLHLHDNNGSYGMHGLPLDGSINWKLVMKNIEATGYTGNTSLERMKWDYEELSAEEYLTLAFKKARTLDLLRL